MQKKCEIAIDQYEIYKQYYGEDLMIEAKIKDCFKVKIDDYLRIKDCDNAKIQYEIYKYKYGEDRKIETDINDCIIRNKENPPSPNTKPNVNGSTVSPPLLPLLPTPSLPQSKIKLIAGFGNGVIVGKGNGFYGELGMNLNDKSRLSLIGGRGTMDVKHFSDFDFIHWSVGTKVILMKCFFISGHYGTVSSEEVQLLSNNDYYTKILYGFSALTGIDYVNVKHRSHVTAGIGGSYILDGDPKFMFTWNVGIGISIIDLFK